MCLRLHPALPVPAETARVARAAFPVGNTCLTLRDDLGTIFHDEDFAALYPTRGQPAAAPWRLALVTVLQFVEQLSDRQAADAVRARIDWKYVLGLELTDPGFDSTVLSEFRSRLLAGAAEQRLLDAVLARCRERGWLKPRGRQRTDSTHVLARIRAVNRLECIRETLRHALNSLAVVAPAWLQANGQPGWSDRYGRRLDDSRLPTSAFLSSPYDVEARYAKKHTTSWIGYKVHLTETCEDDAPHLITQVETTPGPVADGDVTPQIHQALQEKDLLPGTHLADTGYVDAELLVDSQRDYGVDLIGPTRPDYRWQAKAGVGVAASDFQVHWEAEQAICPEGRRSTSWTPAVDRGHNEVIKIKFSAKDCQACPRRAQCTQGKRRSITVRPHDQYVALEAARLREKSEDYKEEYAKRAGIEGTISQGGEGLWIAALALCRESEDSFATSGDGSGDQCDPHQQLADGQAPRADEDIGLCEVDGVTARSVSNSPAVSRVRENPNIPAKSGKNYVQGASTSHLQACAGAGGACWTGPRASKSDPSAFS
jgi:transposase